MLLRLFGLFFFSLSVSTPAWSAPDATPVIVYTIKEKPFVETIEALGTLRSTEAITLSATVTETIRAIHFDDGQRVKAGDMLVEMTSYEEHALLKDAQSTLAEAERQYLRAKTLVKNGLSTEAVLDQREQAYESAKAQMVATQSRLEDRLILAPFDGVLGLRSVSNGSLVKPGDTITTLDDDSAMKLDFSVPAVFLSTLKPGLTVVAHSDELQNREFIGEVSSLDSRINPNTRSIIVRALVPNPEFVLKPGMLMAVTLEKSKMPRLLLPEEALIQEGFKRFVYVLNENTPLTVTRKQIEIGPRTRGEIVVTQGLSAGDKVVTHGIMRLRDGTKVKVSGEKTKANTIAEIITNTHEAK